MASRKPVIHGPDHQVKKDADGLWASGGADKIPGLADALNGSAFAVAITHALQTPGTTYTGSGVTGYTYDADFSDASITGTTGLVTVSGFNLVIHGGGTFLLVWGPRLDDQAALRADFQISGVTTFGETLAYLGTELLPIDSTPGDRLGALTVQIVAAAGDFTVGGLYTCPANTGTAPTVHDGAVFVYRLTR